MSAKALNPSYLWRRTPAGWLRRLHLPGSVDWPVGGAEGATTAPSPVCRLSSTVYMACVWLTSPMGSDPHGRCAVDARYQHRAWEAEGRRDLGNWQRAKRPLLKVVIRVTSCCLANTLPEPGGSHDSAILIMAGERVRQTFLCAGSGDFAVAGTG